MEEIYRKYYRELFLYSLSLCRDHHLAQDLTSDVFLKAYLSADMNADHFKFWLFRVCRNLYLDQLKKDGKLVYEDKSRLTETMPGPMEDLIRSEARENLCRTILELPRAHREILILYYFSGFSLRQIAGIHGITPGNAKVRLHRARTQLKINLEGEHEL